MVEGEAASTTLMEEEEEVKSNRTLLPGDMVARDRAEDFLEGTKPGKVIRHMSFDKSPAVKTSKEERKTNKIYYRDSKKLRTPFFFYKNSKSESEPGRS